MANCQKAGFIETWGRGINKIRQGLKKMGLPEPTIENHVSGTLITIYRNVGVNGTNDTNNVGNMSETNLTERQRFILSSIKKNPLITGKEMSETLSVTQRTVERDLAAMQKAGIIFGMKARLMLVCGWCLKIRKIKIERYERNENFHCKRM